MEGDAAAAEEPGPDAGGGKGFAESVCLGDDVGQGFGTGVHLALLAGIVDPRRISVR
jgi:hypothetical protein